VVGALREERERCAAPASRASGSVNLTLRRERKREKGKETLTPGAQLGAGGKDLLY